MLVLVLDGEAAVQQIWHTQDSYDQNPALAQAIFREYHFKRLMMFRFLSAAAPRKLIPHKFLIN